LRPRCLFRQIKNPAAFATGFLTFRMKPN